MRGEDGQNIAETRVEEREIEERCKKRAKEKEKGEKSSADEERNNHPKPVDGDNRETPARCACRLHRPSVFFKKFNMEMSLKEEKTWK